jgi:hypothetical protein
MKHSTGQMPIIVKDGGLGTNRPRIEVTEIWRAPIRRAGYEVVRYKRKLYVLRGGIRTEHFISLDLPVTNKSATISA